MPREGWKSLTVRDEVFDYWYKKYETEKEKMFEETGTKGFTAYMTRKLFQLKDMEEIVQKIWREQGDELKKRGIYTLPALLEEAIRLLMEEMDQKAEVVR
ncbi:MAG: hypothetical protein HY619_07885, partial [Thaumarchaeota archaeon]|nr:hypothetical protein [Nitrososphaerota archaeon]